MTGYALEHNRVVVVRVIGTFQCFISKQSRSGISSLDSLFRNPRMMLRVEVWQLLLVVVATQGLRSSRLVHAFSQHRTRLVPWSSPRPAIYL